MSESNAKDAFAAQLADILNKGALNLAMGLGYQLGLFEALDNQTAPVPPEGLAEETGLDARYIREWLGVMATGGIVTVSQGADQERFSLPKEHADLLTRRGGSENMGVYTQETPLLTKLAMNAVLQGFQTGEGAPMEMYPEFQNFMGQLAEAKHRTQLVQSFLPSIEDGALVSRLQQGLHVCDAGCAEGEALLLMAQAFPKSSFTGIDVDLQALETARAKAKALGCENVFFAQLDLAACQDAPEWKERFDYITAFDAIHDQQRPLAALRGIRSMLRPDGLFSMVDIAAESDISGNLQHPMGPFLYTVSLMHCMPLGLWQGGAGLGMMWGRERAKKMLQEAGFHDVTLLSIPHDPFNDHYLCRTQSPAQR